MIRKIKRVMYVPLFLYHKFYRNISDYWGSMLVKKYSHSSTIIRKFKDADLKKVLEIFEACFGNKNYQQIVKYSKQFRNILYIYEINGTIIGYVGYYVHQKYVNLKRVHVATLYSIAVDTPYRDKGYGSQLLKESIKEMQNNTISSVNLYVNIKNKEAVSLYQKNGFVKIETLKDICGLGNDCYKMRLDLK